MKVFEYLDRIGKMNKLVQRRLTGTPVEFAQQLGVSRTSLYELLDELRSRGAPIQYSKSTRTFYYSQPFDISVTCSLRPLNYSEEKENYGGLNFYSTILFFRTLPSDLSTVTLPC
jgi:predicted DNA-binding transcriptional regulator YafY